MDFIARNGTVAVCAYCGTDDPDEEEEKEEVPCVPFNKVMDLIGDGINWAYRSADDEGIPYETGEGGYAFPEHMHDTYDLVVDELEIADTDSVREEIIAALPDQTWCHRGFWSLSLYEALKFGWDEFVEQVKYRTRYLFTVAEEPPHSPSATRESRDDSGEVTPEELEPLFPSGDPDFDIGFDRQEGIPVHQLLDAIGQLLRRLELVITVPRGTIIYRVRVEDKGKELHGPEELGPPAREQATQPNRMSPAGIVMFYGAAKSDTALLETFQPTREGADKKSVWVSPFRFVKEVRVLDLTRLPPVPSIFDQERRDLLNGISFLHSFEEDFVQPIKRDGHEHIDYVPTQIVTEYIRHIFRTDDGQRLDGIVYRSSKQARGTACVLFIDGSNCGVPVEHWQEPVQVLQLLESRIRVLDGAKAAEWYPKG